MNGVVKFIIFVLAGVGLGYFSALHMADGGRFSGALHAGPWMTWPEAGSGAGSPYGRLHFILSGQVPPSHFDRIVFEARRDDAGRPLQGSCAYRLEGPMLAVRWWVLSAYPLSGEGGGQEAVSELSSRDVLHDARGRLIIGISGMARAGNWLPTPGEDDFILVLRLFRAGAIGGEKLYHAPLRIIREGCS